MKYAALFALLFLCTNVSAQSAMFGTRMVSKGDAITRARDIAGNPDHVDKIEADTSSPAMEIWTYTRRERVVTLWVVDKKVVQVQDRHVGEEVAGSAQIGK